MHGKNLFLKGAINYAIKTQRKARNAPRAVSLWNERSEHLKFISDSKWLSYSAWSYSQVQAEQVLNTEQSVVLAAQLELTAGELVSARVKPERELW